MHAPSRQGYKPLWMYVCPACGSDPTPDELESLRSGKNAMNVPDRYEMNDMNDDDW